MAVTNLFCFTLAVVLCITTDFTSAQGQVARWCTISRAEQVKCEDLQRAIEAVRKELEPPVIDPKNPNPTGIPQFFCVRGEDVFDCMKKIENNQADLITLESGQGYFAGRYHNMMPLMAENYNDNMQDPETFYYAVAVVKADSAINLDNLSGMRSCHTGIGRSAGWVYPMGKLINRGIIQTNECNAAVKSVSNFFGKMCLPGALNSFYNPFGNNPTSVCAMCTGVGEEWCSSDDPYAGYDGAFKCLAHGVGDIAWVRDSTVSQMVKSGGFKAENYRLLCPNGNKESVDNFKNCEWGRISSHIVMTSGIREMQMVKLYREFLVNISAWFRPTGAHFQKMNLFDSSKYSVYDRSNLLFTDGTNNLWKLPEQTSYYSWVDTEFRGMLNDLNRCPVRIVRWCVLSEEEKEKCEDMLMAFRAKDLEPDLDCVLGGGTEDCVRMIRYGDADMMTLDAGDLYHAGKEHGLVPIAQEDYGDMTGGFYVVAAARKPDSYLTLFNLKGKRSCQGGVRTGDGWFVPVSTFMETTQIRPESCNIFENVGELFARSCIPGALEYSYNPKGTPVNLCEGCAAGGYRKCQRNNLELYYKATGSFRCLVENGGDVAFVRHLTVRINTDGRNAAIWARNRRSDDYEIMCKDGSRKAIDQYPSCNLGWVPSNVVVTGKHKSAREREIYWNLLNYAQQFFSTDSDSDFAMFSSGINQNDLLFTDAAVRLLQISEDKQDYRSYLGGEFLSMVENVERFTCSSSHKTIVNFSLLFLAIAFKFVL
ncbi:melanotransferrin-like [Liolophura sinensis]|uniref:melanotransferrin-like n=1 Tax=Liolophura sinensis TaxID=3198878 RepID=UPI003158E848